MDNYKQNLLKLLRNHAFEEKKVTLASGKESNFYIDVKRVSLMAEGCHLLGKVFFTEIQKIFPQIKAVGGMTLGADPLVSAVASESFAQGKPIDAFIIRKEPKAYGLSRWIEGGDRLDAHSPILILEDVTTSGGSSIQAVERAREKDFDVKAVFTVVDRQEGAAEKIKNKTGLELYSLFKKTDFGRLN